MSGRSVAVGLDLNVSGYIAKLGQASAATQAFATKAVDAGKRAEQATVKAADGATTFATKHKQAISSVSTGLGVFGAAVAVGVGVAVKSFADFDAEMSNVAATGADAKQNLGALRDAAIQAGAATKFSATEAAQGEEALAKAGVSAKDVLGGGLKGALDLAAAGQIAVGDAAETAATAMTQFNLTGKDVPHIADLLAAGAGKAQGEVSDMAAALKQSGLVAAQFGLSIEDTTGTLAAFASAGLIGSDAGTSFKTMLLSLANPSKQSAATMKSLGINAYDAAGKFVGVTNLAGQLQSKLGGLSQAQRNAALATIFGTDAIRAANVLYKDGSKGIQDWIKNVDDTGYAAQTAATKMDNLKGDLEQFKGSLETALIGVGSGANGPLRGIVEDATNAVNAFNGLGSGAKQSLLGIGAGLAAVALGAAALGKLAVFAAEARTALTGLGITASGTRAKLAGLNKGALLSAAGFIAVQAASAALDKQLTANSGSVDDFTKSLQDVAGQGLQLDYQFKKFGSSTALAGQGITDTASAFKALHEAQNPVAKGFQVIGDALGMSSSLGILTSEFGKLDQALVQMKPADAAVAFQQLSKQASAAGISMQDQLSIFGDYKQKLVEQANQLGITSLSAQDYFDWMGGKIPTAITRAQQVTQGAGAGFSAVEQAIGSIGNTAGQATQDLDALANSMFAVGNAAIATSNAKIGFAQSIEAAAKAAEKGKRGISAYTKAGQENRTALNNLASQGQQYVEGLIKQGKSAKTVEAATSRARAEFVKAATAMTGSKKKANELADSYGLIPKNVKTKVNQQGAQDAKKRTDAFHTAIKALPKDVRTKVESAFKRGGIDAALAALRGIDGKTATTYVKTVRYTVKAAGSNRNVVVKDPGGYTGGLFDGTRFTRRSDGGPVWGAGTATSDSVPALLSNGEYVIRAAAVKAVGADLLDAINASGYAGGGPVGFATGGTVDAARIMRMIAQLVTPLTAVRSTDAALKAAAAALAKENKDVAAARAQQKRARSKKQKSAANSNLTKQLDEQKTAQEKLKDATTALADAQNQAADSARSMSDQFADAFRSTSTDAKDWLDSMKQGAGDLTAFTAQITNLRKQGLSETLIQQLIGQGAAQGGEAAGSILSGGKGLIDQLNKSNAALQKAADALGYISALTPQRKALGGPISGPGTGTSDSVHVMASRGEWVVPEHAVAANRPYLEAITYGGRDVVSHNYARPGHYRYGGQVSTGVSVSDLRGALTGMRIVGDLEMVGSRALIRGIAVETYSDETRKASVAF